MEGLADGDEASWHARTGSIELTRDDPNCHSSLAALEKSAIMRRITAVML